MSADQKPKVLLFGVGSVGAVYLYLLSKVASTTAVCRSNYDIVKANGFTIHSSIFGDNLHIQPNVVRSCDAAASQDTRPFDYILVCCKVIPGVPNLIKPAVTPGRTVIVLIQNGIGIEAEYATAFPNNPIVTGAVYCKTTQRPAGVVRHDEVELLELGSYPSSASNGHAEAFVKLIQSTGATAELHDDVQTKRWYKLLVNASWNPICALTMCTDVGFLQSSSLATTFVLDIMLEVCAIADAYGYTFQREEAEYQLARAVARIERGNAVEPSMLQDVREGRRIEVEAIVGNAVRMGRERGVRCDKLECLYVLAKARDAQLGRDKADNLV
ncbi:2-dehydropantoate 2-reductase [Trematosphaeria pertusa]|uniref:2-dehydropantoate 2-reductase n=1 Tax=Trematosphaeria pertusa TaxID=390896 RepID=A0A6A6I4R4_9PLEO|nr:2-dehydropantoate 2-reductase [Trematosphaeria pertusa]KAF2245018.1 2-dehydropantoate 2-reductase [Trematosphaeria pertusa]